MWNCAPFARIWAPEVSKSMKGTGGDGGGGGAPGGDGDVFGMHIEWYSLSTSQTHCGLPQHTVGPV